MADSNHRPAEHLALEFFDRVWTPPNDLDAIDELMTEDYVITSGGQEIIGREAFKAWDLWDTAISGLHAVVGTSRGVEGVYW